MQDEGWIGVDLDGTLARYVSGDFKGVDTIGEPIPAMVERVKQWLADGRDVRIFTARVANHGEAAIAPIRRWCREHLGRELPVTNVKDHQMWELYDDRAVQVEANTGRLLGRSTRGLE